MTAIFLAAISGVQDIMEQEFSPFSGTVSDSEQEPVVANALVTAESTENRYYRYRTHQ